MEYFNGQNRFHWSTSDPCKPPTMTFSNNLEFIGVHPNDENLSNKLTDCVKVHVLIDRIKTATQRDL